MCRLRAGSCCRWRESRRRHCLWSSLWRVAGASSRGAQGRRRSRSTGVGGQVAVQPVRALLGAVGLLCPGPAGGATGGGVSVGWLLHLRLSARRPPSAVRRPPPRASTSQRALALVFALVLAREPRRRCATKHALLCVPGRASRAPLHLLLFRPVQHDPVSTYHTGQLAVRPSVRPFALPISHVPSRSPAEGECHAGRMRVGDSVL